MTLHNKRLWVPLVCALCVAALLCVSYIPHFLGSKTSRLTFLLVLRMDLLVYARNHHAFPKTLSPEGGIELPGKIDPEELVYCVSGKSFDPEKEGSSDAGNFLVFYEKRAHRYGLDTGYFVMYLWLYEFRKAPVGTEVVRPPEIFQFSPLGTAVPAQEAPHEGESGTRQP